MTEHTKQHITTTELSRGAREVFENYVEQYKAILKLYNTANIKNFLKAQPEKEHIQQITEILHQIKILVREKRAQDKKANKKLPQLIKQVNPYINYEQELQKDESERSFIPFSEGKAAIKFPDAKWYFINEFGMKVMGPFLIIQTGFIDGRAVVIQNTDVEKSLIDHDGLTIYSTWDIQLKKEFPATIKDRARNRHNYIDRDGNELYERGFVSIKYQDDEYKLAVITFGAAKFIDGKGGKLKGGPYQDATRFINGFAGVQNRSTNHWHLRTPNQPIFFPGPFEEITEKNGRLYVKTKNKEMWVNEQGELKPIKRRKKKVKKAKALRSRSFKGSAASTIIDKQGKTHLKKKR